MSLYRIDSHLITFARKIQMPLSRLAIFVVFYWFGMLKVVGASPASPLVASLREKTLPSFSPELFLILFGIYEVIIGISFLLKGYERLAMALLIPHMIMTALPFILLPHLVWTGFLVPTLEGQYIIKNLLILALSLGIAAELTPFASKSKD